MNADITINDGTTSRVYKTSLGGTRQVSRNKYEHLRKTAEFDNTPETLTSTFTKDGKVHITKVELAKTKVDSVTGKVSVMKTIQTQVVEPGVFTQTEADNQIKEMSVFTGTAGIATDINQGNI